MSESPTQHTTCQPATTPTLRCLQFNAGHEKAATQQLRRTLTDEKIGLLFIQEPYHIRNRVSFPGATDAAYLISDETPLSALISLTSSARLLLIQQHSTPNQTVCEVTMNGSPNFIAISVYWSPAAIGRERQVLADELNSAINAFSHRPLIICGDFNARSTLWHDAVDVRCNELIELIAIHNLTLHNDSTPTYENYRRVNAEDSSGTSIIDLVLTNHLSTPLVNNCRVGREGTATQHNYVHFNIGTSQQDQLPTGEQLFRYRTDKADWPAFKLNFQAQVMQLCNELEYADTAEQLDSFAVSITKAVTTAATASIPLKKPTVRLSDRCGDWWTEELKQQRTSSRRLLARSRRCRNPERKMQLYAEYQTELKRYKEAIIAAKDESFRRFCTTASRDNPWDGPFQIAKRRATHKVNRCVATLRKPDGELTTSAEDTANLLLDTFFPVDDPSSDAVEHQQLREEARLLPDSANDRDFTAAEVEAQLKSICPSKAPGLDGLTSDICLFAFHIAPVLFTNFYNRCLWLGHFPTTFKRSTVCLIPKDSATDLSAPKSFRPISLLPVFGKTLEGLAITRVNYHVATYCPISKYQFGFREGLSTEHAVHEVISFLHTAHREGDKCLAISLDVQGAFDHAWWPLILKELRDRRCPLNLHCLFQSFLDNREAILPVGNTTCSRQLTRGCPQGSKASPSLWNLLYDGLLRLDLGPNIKLVAYADDVILLARAKYAFQHTQTPANPADYLPNIVNPALDKIWAWAQSAKLTFNPGKSIGLYPFSSGKAHPDIRMNGQRIKFADSLRYLGVILDRDLNFQVHIDTVAKRSLTLLNELSSLARKSWGIGPKAMRTIYLGAIEPAMTYAASVWYGVARYRLKPIERVQRLAALRLSQAYRTTSTDALLALTGLVPIDLKLRELSTNFYYLRSKQAIPTDLQLPGFSRYSQPVNREHPADRSCIGYTRQPPTDADLLIFTDGSKCVEGVGSSVVFTDPQHNPTHTYNFRLDDRCSIFQAEAYAIQQAIGFAELIFAGQRIAIVTDSLSVCLALGNSQPTSPLIAEIHGHWRSARSNSYSLHWTRGHQGTKGNELADKAAKAAATDRSKTVLYWTLPFSTAKELARQRSLEDWQQRWTQTPNGAWTRQFIPEIRLPYNRKLPLCHELTQLLTNHGDFGSYLESRQIASRRCSCGEEETASHLLLHCPDQTSHRDFYLTATNQHTLEPGSALKAEKDLAELTDLARSIMQSVAARETTPLAAQSQASTSVASPPRTRNRGAPLVPAQPDIGAKKGTRRDNSAAVAAARAPRQHRRGCLCSRCRQQH